MNQYGTHLVLISGIFYLGIIFSTATNYEYSVETFITITAICVSLIFIGFWLSNLRTLEKAQLDFHPEGIIMSSNSGYIPLKYESIKKISTSNITFKRDKSQFFVISKDNRKFEIQTDKDIYEGMVEYFPEV